MPLPPEESTCRRIGSDNSLVVRRDTTSGGFNSKRRSPWRTNLLT